MGTVEARPIPSPAATSRAVLGGVHRSPCRRCCRRPSPARPAGTSMAFGSSLCQDRPSCQQSTSSPAGRRRIFSSSPGRGASSFESSWWWMRVRFGTLPARGGRLDQCGPQYAVHPTALLAATRGTPQLIHHRTVHKMCGALPFGHLCPAMPRHGGGSNPSHQRCAAPPCPRHPPPDPRRTCSLTLSQSLPPHPPAHSPACSTPPTNPAAHPRLRSNAGIVRHW